MTTLLDALEEFDTSLELEQDIELAMDSPAEAEFYTSKLNRVRQLKSWLMENYRKCQAPTYEYNPADAVARYFAHHSNPLT